MTEAELQALDDPEAPNLPEAMPGHQGSKLVPEAERRQRREAMTAMLAQGVSRDAIFTTFMARFNMTEAAVKQLMTDVRAMWDDEDAEAARYAKGAARRRLHRHIQEAAKDRKWTAVANLEGVLADVEGTNVKDEDLPVDVDARLSEALLAVLNATDTKEVRVMIERERMLIELGPEAGAGQLAAQAETIVEAPQEQG